MTRGSGWRLASLWSWSLSLGIRPYHHQGHHSRYHPLDVCLHQNPFGGTTKMLFSLLKSSGSPYSAKVEALPVSRSFPKWYATKTIGCENPPRECTIRSIFWAFWDRPTILHHQQNPQTNNSKRPWKVTVQPPIFQGGQLLNFERV